MYFRNLDSGPRCATLIGWVLCTQWPMARIEGARRSAIFDKLIERIESGRLAGVEYTSLRSRNLIVNPLRLKTLLGTLCINPSGSRFCEVEGEGVPEPHEGEKTCRNGSGGKANALPLCSG